MTIIVYAGDEPDIAVGSGESWNTYSNYNGQQIYRTSSAGIYSDSASTSNNVRISSTPTILRSTSSIKYKTDVQDMTEEEINSLYQTRPVFYKSLSHNDNPNHTFYGFIAEEIEETCPLLVEWNDEDPNNLIADGVQYDRITVFLVGIAKKQKTQIEQMQNKLTELKDRLNVIKSREG